MKRVMRFWNLNGPRGHIENEDCPKPDKCIPTGEYVLTKDELRKVWEAGKDWGEWGEHLQGDEPPHFDNWAKEHGVI